MIQANDHVLDYVDDYLHEVMGPDDVATLERHCESCRVCKVALEEARRRFAALETVAASEASEQLIQQTMQKIDAHEKSWRRFRRYAAPGACWAAAAAILIVGAFHLHYLNLTPSPYDLKVFGQAELLADTDGSLRVQLMDHRTGAAIAKAPVEIRLRDPNANQFIQLASFTTNAQGTGQPRFRVPNWADGAYELSVVARPVSAAPEVVTQTIKLQRSWKLMLSSDKPVYQPGQEIHVRSLALRRPDLKPVAGQDVTFSITDPKGNVIFKRKDVTSTYGIASADCPLAYEILEGAYAIECKLGDTRSKQTVEVKKYVLPKFKIDVTLDQPYYQPGKVMHGTVQADYFFGKPVAGADVAIELQGTDVEQTVLQRISIRTDDAGKASFECKLPDKLVGREQDSGDARVAVQATVTDSAGQKQARMVSRTVTANPLRIEVIPEAGSLLPGFANTVYLFTSYADGRPARVRLVVSGVDRELTTTDLGVASFELTPESNEVDLTIRATDDKGQVGRRQVTLRWEGHADDFLVRPEKSVYDGGETMRVAAMGLGVQPIFVDFIKDGQTVLTETIEMSGGRGQVAFDLPPELFGTVELSAYRFGISGLAVRKTRVLYIRQAKQLSIQAAMDHAEYRPGHAAKMKLALTDDQGKPTPGAVILAAVDEAVFSVLDQAPGMEKTFYLLEQQLLKPVYAIYGWAPDLFAGVPAAERNQFEQALFSRTAQARGGNQVKLLDNNGRVLPRSDSSRSPQALFVSSFPTKVQLINAARRSGLHGVRVAWTTLLGLVAALVIAWGSIAVWRLLRTMPTPELLVAGLLILIVMMTSITTLGTNANQTFTAVGSAVNTGGGGSGESGLAVPDLMSLRAPRNQRSIPQYHHQLKVMVLDDSGSMPSDDAAFPQGSTPPHRVREWFPETLLWRPELITDDKGHASIDVELADSITTWRLTASAVSADGRLGATQTPIRVFQPFFVDLNLPVALTRGDEVGIPVVVYNYLDKPQTVELSLDNAAWFERLDDGAKQLDLAAGEVRSTAYRLRVTKVGNHHLQVTARGSGVADAIKKQIEVVPDGRRVEQVFNGTLQQPVNLTLDIPRQAIEGSPRAILKIYPSSFSQLVEGLDAIFRMPYGCFEQTSSTTYPNLLALDYLRRTKKSVPEVEAKARQYVHLGYQRLIGFEVQGGGFDWFGRPPANVRLTAYGLMEFEDMARVHDVDPSLIARTRQWLLSKRNQDGSWSASSGLHTENDPARGQTGDMANFSTTAYVAWAVFRDRSSDPDAQTTRDYLLSHRPDAIPDPYVLALACNALAVLDPSGQHVKPYLDRLDSMKRSSEDGKLTWWDQAPGQRTTFYGSGRSGSIETTALAALAMLEANQYPATTRAALSWLTTQKDASGTWHSTQATVLALKALLAGTGKSLGGEQERRIEIVLNENEKHHIVIPADQADVMKQLDLSDSLTPRTHRLTISERGDTAPGYQLAFRYHVPDSERQGKNEPLAITLNYDRSDLKVGDTVTATATVVNQMTQSAPMVLLDLPIPAGFALELDDLAKLVSDGAIAKFQVNARSAIVYLRGLEPGKPLTLRYRLRATMPVKLTVPPAQVYEYYDPDKKGASPATRLTVAER